MSNTTSTRPQPAQTSGRFTGKVALVAGGGWTGPDDFAIGIGAAISQLLAREGCRVAVLDIAAENAERTLGPISREGGDAFAIVADVAREADCKRAVEEVMARYGRLDIVVNNVGIGGAPGYDDPEAAFDRIWAVNFKSQFLMAKHAVPHMPRGGAIVNVGSVFGADDPIGAGAYAVSKRAVSLAGTPGLATEYAPQGIRVNCVTAGYVWNAVTQQVQPRQAKGESMENYRRGRAKALNALGIEGDGWDVAKAVAFLASDDARWITGQDLFVDGGYALLSVFDVSPYGRGLRDTSDTPS